LSRDYLGSSIQLRLTLRETSDVEVALYDVSGRLADRLFVGEIAPEPGILDLTLPSTLGSTCYFAQVNVNGSAVLTRKLVLVR
jgi:hypothetical protein